MSETPEADTKQATEQRKKRWLLIVGLGLLIAFVFIVILAILPWIFTGNPRFWEIRNYIGPRQTADRVALAGMQIQTMVAFVQLIGGLVLFWVIYNGYQTLRQAQEQVEIGRKQLRLTEEGQITDRFTKAIEQLGAVDAEGKPQLERRLGAIYALERIAKDSHKDYGPIMEVLTAYVRQHSPVPAIYLYEPLPDDYRMRIDLQAILTVLGRRVEPQDSSQNMQLDLTNTDLRRADLTNAMLSRVNFARADFREANFREANLTLAIFMEANLSRSRFQRANFVRANLLVADLSKTWLQEANFEEANLIGADLSNTWLKGTNFAKADLTGADLRGSDLRGANLTGAILGEADLEGATLCETDLSQALGLSKKQIEMSIMNEDTVLPTEPFGDRTILRCAPRVHPDDESGNQPGSDEATSTDGV